ncbi:MAG: hypothetical protein SPJ62_17050 [Inconstantimicrobium porci]|uniref:hypothetical protein n=1 Tax=Inconstantimicrobium porci TaxID=2652291 RepID=UPI002A9132A4|nr:hypothetical protein [Inconstantimicrobium porci]MDY5913672.1 hypothetical protein [Inconstantimicrobium porci]
MGWIADAVAGTIQGIASPVVQLYEGHQNRKAQKEANKANIELQRETNEKNEALLREHWEREDSAIQRQVADAQAAGVSPIGNLNGSPSTLSTSMVAPTVDPVTSGDMARALGESLSSFATLISDKSERQKDRAQQRKMQDEEHSHAVAVLDKQLESAYDEKEKDRLQAFKLSCNQLKQLILTENHKTALELTKQFQESVRTATGGMSVHYKLVDNYAQYKSELQAWNNQYYMFVSSEVPQYSSETTSGSSSASTSAGGNVGASVLGTGLNVGANGSSSQSQSSTSSTSTGDNNTPYYKLRSWLLEHPMPVYDKTGYFSKVKGGK